MGVFLWTAEKQELFHQKIPSDPADLVEVFILVSTAIVLQSDLFQAVRRFFKCLVQDGKSFAVK